MVDQSYTTLSQSLLVTLRTLEDPDLDLDALAEHLEQGYVLLEKLKSKLTETECQVERVIRLHQGAPT